MSTLVTATEFGVSYTKPCPFFSTGTQRAAQLAAIAAGGSVRLNVVRWNDDEPNAMGGLGVSYRHPSFDGLKFATTDDAADFALSVGLLKVYVSKVRAS